MNDLVNFFFEAGFLKRLPRSGWFYLGKDNPESVADHSFRTAVVGYFIAKMEDADADKVMKMCLFHDFHEARVGDLNKVNQRYIDPYDSEKKSMLEALQSLDEKTRNELLELHSDFGSSSKEGIVSKDADLIECALQAKEYIDEGYVDAIDWINNISKSIKTDTAKKLLEEIKNTKSSDWWMRLKNIK